MSDTPPDVNDPTASSTIEELRALIHEAESALGGAETDNGDEIEELRERLRGAVAEGQNVIRNLGDTIKRQASRADDAIRDNPFQAIGIAAGLGLIAGFILCRRGSD